MVTSSGLAMSSEQQTTVVEILGSRFEDSTLQSSASDRGPMATLQATLAEISVACATLKNNFQHIDSIVDQNTTEIASLQILLDDLSQRQNAGPQLWRVNRLGQDIRELTERVNRLEQNLRFRRLI
jgi:predicted  nucleic acid-binding Zn-ribbon protein